eukprot:TRINITY_DN7346_c0_g1_i1.p1 TRINITY_DN7346_c0_g1~~TRINITY_DN7346_c0_g1_i1.p1  ORF type:complete len:186 (-),score=-20.52 TRINITY_DN7346_c0_g1_i1:343-849(-)
MGIIYIGVQQVLIINQLKFVKHIDCFSKYHSYKEVCLQQSKYFCISNFVTDKLYCNRSQLCQYFTKTINVFYQTTGLKLSLKNNNHSNICKNQDKIAKFRPPKIVTQKKHFVTIYFCQNNKKLYKSILCSQNYYNVTLQPSKPRFSTWCSKTLIKYEDILSFNQYLLK